MYATPPKCDRCGSPRETAAFGFLCPDCAAELRSDGLGLIRRVVIAAIILAAVYCIATIGVSVARADVTSDRLTAIEQRLNAAGIPELVTTLDKLEGARLDAGKAYRLKVGTYTLANAVTVPKGATLDATGSTITFTSTANWTAAAKLSGDGATLRGGTWTVGSVQRVVEIDGGAAGALVDGVIVGGTQANGLIVLNGTTRTTIRDCRAVELVGYLIFASDARDLTVERCVVTRGSGRETPIRFHGCINLTVRDCDITGQIGKYAAARFHDGRDFTVTGNKFRGIVQIGPMGGGDGGQVDGITAWYDARGVSLGNTRVNADITRTLASRRDKLAHRLVNVTLTDNVMSECYLAIEAGVEGTFVIRGGSIAAPAEKTGKTDQLGQIANRGNAGEYPPTDWRLPGDVIRQPSRPTLDGVAIRGSVTDLARYLPPTWTLVQCTYNGAAFANGTRTN